MPRDIYKKVAKIDALVFRLTREHAKRPIKAAINFTNDNDNIMLYPGTYKENLKIDKNIQ